MEGGLILLLSLYYSLTKQKAKDLLHTIFYVRKETTSDGVQSKWFHYEENSAITLRLM